MSRVNLKTCSLDELENECIRVQGTNFGHNMIGIICEVASERFGEKEADELYDRYQG